MKGAIISHVGRKKNGQSRHTHTLQTSAVVVDVLIPKNLDGFFHVVLFSRPPGDGRARATVVAGQERWCTQYYIQEREIMDA